MFNEGEVEDADHFYCTVMVWHMRERRWLGATYTPFTLQQLALCGGGLWWW